MAYLHIAYLQYEERAKIPPGHLSLSFGSSHLLFTLRDGGIERGKDTFLDFGDEVRPNCRIVLVRTPHELHAST